VTNSYQGPGRTVKHRLHKQNCLQRIISHTFPFILGWKRSSHGVLMEYVFLTLSRAGCTTAFTS
jgi:hypothetical protein